MRRLLPLLLLLLPVAGCNSTPPHTPAAAPDSASAPAGSASSAPPSGAPVATPAATPIGTPPPAAAPPPAGAVDCGTFTLQQGSRLPATAITCLIDAVKQRKAARLQVTRPTVEGDPIITWYAARPDGIVEVTRDATKDKFGGGVGITRELCSGPIPEGDSVRFERCDPA